MRPNSLESARSSLLLVLLLTLASPAFADETTREVSGFHGISVGSSIELVVHQGDYYRVVVRSESGDLDEVETEVSRDTLGIHIVDHWFWVFNFYYWFNHPHYTVEVTLPALSRLAVTGGSNAVFENEFAGDHLTLRTSGGSHINFKGKYDSLEISASGGSVASFEGSAGELTTRTNGGSQIRALKFEVKNADIRASGGSSVAITVHDELTARASGGSRVRYAGNPLHKDISASRGAAITPREYE